MAGVDLNTARELLDSIRRQAHLAPDYKAGAVAKLVQ